VDVSKSFRRVTAGFRLAQLGFVNSARAERLLARPVLGNLVRDAGLAELLAGAADPDLALTGLVRLLEAATDRDVLLAALACDEPFVRRLLAVLGVSAALGDHLARHPDQWQVLNGCVWDGAAERSADFRATLLTAVGADPAEFSGEGAAPRAGSPWGQALDALRVAYRRCLLMIAATDLSGAASISRTAADLADLASAALETALAIARAELPEDAEPCRLAVIGMGKCGGRELNYVSDVDVIFVAEPVSGDETAALSTATRLAAALTRACSQVTAEGALWPVDAALRPEGKAGPLVRTLASHLAYYQRWAKTWEFQALLKARPVAGDLELGQRYVETLSPLVWSAAAREGFVRDVQVMRRRVEEAIPPGQTDRQLKVGPGGLRDVEFAVQLLQLVHGRSDDTLRSGNTLEALAALAHGGYVGRSDAAQLAEAYRFLRMLEHRIQLYRLRRTHLVPTYETELRRLGRSLGFHADPVGELSDTWRRHAREARRLHEKLFYRPLLAAVARLAPDEARLTPQAARTRLEALGYADPAGALRHLEALTSGVSRRAAIQRSLLPVLLGWFAEAADPDAGLLAFRQVSEALGTTPWYLRLLRDEGAAAQRLAQVLVSGRFAPNLLLRAPEAVAMVGDSEGLRPRSRQALEAEMLAAAGRASDLEAAITAVRAIRRRELFRIAAADVLGLVGKGAAAVDAVGEALTSVAAATLASALRAVTAAVASQFGGRLPTRLAILAMGRFGGHELSYGSDVDVMFVSEPDPSATEQQAAEAAHAVVYELTRLLREPGGDPPLVLDADLRPEGRSGPLIRTLAAYTAYYQRWSLVWESQALLRAEPVAGDAELGQRFLALIDLLRWPRSGLTDADIREIRRVKARVEAERLPRGADPTIHLKLGPGGLADVEWTVQLLQLRHATAVPALRTTRTRAALAVAAETGVLSPGDAEVLQAAWLLATRIRNAAMLVRGRPSDSVPLDVRELAGVAQQVLPERSGDAGVVLDDYRRLTRRARAVVERVFYDDGG